MPVTGDLYLNDRTSAFGALQAPRNQLSLFRFFIRACEPLVGLASLQLADLIGRAGGHKLVHIPPRPPIQDSYNWPPDLRKQASLTELQLR
jgi:hypothetical protein